MNVRLPKRKRRVIYVLLLLIIFLTTVVAWVWKDRTDDENLDRYDNSEITSRLSRDIPADIPQVRFKNVTESAGIFFKHFDNVRGKKIAEDMGSGAAWIDYNNDGWEDLFIVNYSAPVGASDEELQNSSAASKLYMNNGDETFTDVSEEAGLNLRVRGMGTAWADYNNDGWIDCLVTTFGENHLYRNNGNGTFTEASKESNIGGMYGFWAGASWGDYNRDGFADLYITGYVDYFDIPIDESMADLQEPPSINPSVFEPARNLLYRNNGDGTFTELAEEAGAANPDGRSLQSAWMDINDDMLPDLYVTNDVSDNMLYRNMGDGTFMNISYPAKIADYRGSMGLAVGDWNGDEDPDFFITHWIAQENALYDNLWGESGPEGMIFFKDESDRLGLGQSSLKYVGWATSFIDIENNGRPDLFVVNGHTNQILNETSKLEGMNDQLYLNLNDEDGFYEISGISGEYFSTKHVGRGGAVADFNNDGLPDLFIVNHNGPGILLKNQSKARNNWLQVQLEGIESNRSALGAKLRLVSESGVQIRQLGSQGSYLSQNSLTEHFGLHRDTNVDSLAVLWPSGRETVLTDLDVNQKIRIREGMENNQSKILQ